jgi:hypothetical protein
MELIENIKLYIKESRRHKAIDRGLYLFRYFLDWKKAQALNRNALSDEWPWITFRAKTFLPKLLSKDSNVFEYGAGGSTLFFAKHVGTLVSVEHDSSWFDKLQKLIKEKKINNWKGFLEKPEFLPDKQILDPANPFAYVSADERYLFHSFRSYASRIDDFDNLFFDFISVDGRARPSCILHAIPKLKLGGYLMLDNADRDYYLEYFIKSGFDASFKVVFDNFGPGPYNSIFWRTTIWQKVSL